MSATSAVLRPSDPYQFRADEIAEPPQSLLAIVRKIGPGMILTASIVGSGELIATTTLGAEVGYAALWLIILSCVVKPAVQSELGRYVVATGHTGAEGFNVLPGPKVHGVNWALLAWCAMLMVTFFVTGAMYGGVAQVLHLLTPSIPRPAWIVAEAILTLTILLGGHYVRIERLATLKVCLFTIITVLAAAVLAGQPTFAWADVAEGLRLQLPGQGLATAVAVFGITGVGSAELMMYPYWCVEKGYARFAGTNDGSAAWRTRAHGWVRVMNIDIVASMVVYTAATVAFYLLGAGVLHARGLVPSASDMIPVLSKMYTETLGPWATWVFYAGALATLYGTIFAFTAGNCRVLADVARLAGLFARDDYAARVRWRNRFIWIHTVVPVALILAIGSPVRMVRWGGIAQAIMLPVIALGAVYLRHYKLPTVLRPGRLATAGLWFAALLTCVLMAYYAYLSVRSV